MFVGELSIFVSKGFWRVPRYGKRRVNQSKSTGLHYVLRYVVRPPSLEYNFYLPKITIWK